MYLVVDVYEFCRSENVTGRNTSGMVGGGERLADSWDNFTLLELMLSGDNTTWDYEGSSQ